MPRIRYLLLAILFGTGLATTLGSGGGGNNGGTPPPAGLAIVERSPAANATDVDITTEVSARFNMALDTATVTNATFTLTPEGGTAVTATISFADGDTSAVLTPGSALEFDTLYTATLADTIASITTGDTLDSPVSWAFRTEGPFGVSQVSPQDGAENVVVGQTVSATFNRELDTATVDETTFTLAPSAGGAAIAANISFADNDTRAVLALAPDAVLAPATAYTVTLADTVASTTGETLGAEQTWTFTTAQGLVRVNTDSTDMQPTSGASTAPSSSADGRYVAFMSLADLVSADTNGVSDIYVKDTQTGVIIMASTTSSGAPISVASAGPSISADGRYVAFESDGIFVAEDTNGASDIYVKDTFTGAIARASTAADGSEVFANSNLATVSSDGRFVAFQSSAAGFIGSGCTDGTIHIFRKDLQTGDVLCLSKTDTQTANGNNGAPRISADGRYVAFVSQAVNLDPARCNDGGQIYRADAQTGDVECASSTGTVAGNSSSTAPAISADGQFVAFQSTATNLVAACTGTTHIFLADMASNDIECVSRTTSGDGNGISTAPAVAVAGTHVYVAFESQATNLAASCTDGIRQVLVKNMTDDTLGCASAGGTSASGEPQLSADGRYVSFSSRATNLVTPDDNGVTDDILRSLNEVF